MILDDLPDLVQLVRPKPVLPGEPHVWDEPILRLLSVPLYVHVLRFVTIQGVETESSTVDPQHDGHLQLSNSFALGHLSDHTASSLPTGSAKWNLRPPGKLNVSRVIRPPARATLV